MAKQPGGKLTFVLGFVLFFAVLWFLWDTALVYPLKIFVVLLHEISHAMAAVATGGGIEKITLSAQQGGACHCGGGSAFLTLSAGYLGSLVWGGLMFSAARSEKIETNWVNGVIGAVVVLLTLFFVRSTFGVIFGIAFGIAMIVTAKNLGPAVNRGLLFTLGLTSVLYAILDIKSDIIDRPEVRSDAFMLAELTGIPTIVWGFVWITLAIAVAAWLLRKAYNDA